MKGEDLHGLDLKDLSKLEAILESGLTAVVKTKVNCWKSCMPKIKHTNKIVTSTKIDSFSCIIKLDAPITLTRTSTYTRLKGLIAK